MEKVQDELLVVYATQLLEKEQSGCVLFRGNKVDDLSRMYRFYRTIRKGLEQWLMHSDSMLLLNTVLVQQLKMLQRTSRSRSPRQLYGICD